MYGNRPAIRLITFTGLFFNLLLLLDSCLDIKSYPPEPVITFKEFRYADTTLIFDFSDGDGNFGIPSYDSIPPFNFGSPYYYNLIVKFEEKTDSGFKVPDNFVDPEMLNSRIMDVPQPTGQNKTMRGSIEYKFREALGRIDYHMPDTFRFRCYIYDLDLNKSNELVTPPLTYRQFIPSPGK